MMLKTLLQANSRSSRVVLSAVSSGGSFSSSWPIEQRSFCRRASASVMARVRLE
jgi:hypothetical protein